MTLRGVLSCLTAAAIATASAVAAAAQTRQAISTSLTECGVIFDELSRLAERRGNPEDQIVAAQVTAAMFLVEAREQARREQQPHPHSHVSAEAERLTEKWDGRFSRITLLGENKDWIDYCRALGKNRGIALP